MSQIPFPTSPFEPVRSYDVPELLISQALDRELSLESVRNTLFAPDKLSLKQRETYVTSLKERMGRSPLSDAVIDLATNPFVWMTFAFSPAGAQGLRAGARTIFGPSVKYSAWVLDNAPWLRSVLTGTQAYTGTPVPQALMQVTEDINRLGDQVAKKINPHLDVLRERLGVKVLDAERIANPVKKQALREIDQTMGAWLRGWDTVSTEFQPIVKKVKDPETGKGVFAGVGIREVSHPKLIQENLEQKLKGLGAWDLATNYRDAMNERWVGLFGDEAAFAAGRGFVTDRDKVIRLWRGVATNRLTGGKLALDADSGMGVIAQLMGPEVAEGVRAGAITTKKFLDMVDMVAQAPLKSAQKGRGFYFPRNQVDVYGGGAMSSADLSALRESRQYIKGTGSSVPRSTNEPIWHPDDLDELFNPDAGLFTATDEGAKFLGQQAKIREAMLARGGNRDGIYVQRLNTFKGLHRYFKDTGETAALYGRKLEDAPRVAVKRQDSLDALTGPVPGKGVRQAELQGRVDQAKGRAAQMQQIRDEFVANKQWGGTSMADVLQESYFMMPGGKNGYLKTKLRDVFIPQVTGRFTNVREASAYAAAIDAKHGLKAFLDTSVGKAMRDSGGFTKGLYDRLTTLSDFDVPLSAGSGLSRGLAKYLYVTHLGVNMASMTLNLMQPMLLASTWMGSRAVAEGYVRGFRELGGYLSERVGTHGLKSLDDLTHRALIKKHFKFADADRGGELMGIGRDAFETMDNISFPPNRLGTAAHRESVIFDYPMKLFEKAEWLNRSVTAHAVEAAHRRAGLNIQKGTQGFFRMQNDVDEAVQATQFGSGKMNTPLVFMDGPMANPLLRQFFSFPLRSFTGIAYQSPRVGGRSGTRAGAIIHDYMRGMGISAVVYETGKGLFGADLSRGLFQSAITDVVGGERFFQDGNEFIPVPPVIAIPIDLTKGVFSGDQQLLSLALPRLLPGGVALSRAFNIAPKSPELVAGLPRSLQRTYVDWANPSPEGLYPVHKGDGSLISYQPGPALLLKGLGLDLGSFKAEGDIDGFLVKQRDQIVEARRQVMSAYLGNEITKGDRIRQAFKKKFGYDLTFTKQQIKQARDQRRRPRTERILNNLPREVRPAYTDLVARSRADRLALTEAELRENETARTRDQFREPHADLDPETLARLRELVEANDKGRQLTEGTQAFEPFTGFE